MNRKPSWLGVALLCSLWLLLRPLPIQAHANLVRSEPAAGSTLTEAPTVILLTFTEPLDAAASAVYLADANGDEIVPGPGELDSDDARNLRLPLPPLAEGTYSAIWQARSAVDGHITRGNVGFSVGAGSAVASFLPPPGTADPATARPHPADTIARWWLYLSAAATVGPILLALLVWQPVRQQTALADDGQSEALLRRLAWWGCVAGLAGTVIFTGVQAGLIGAGGVVAMLSGRNGILLAARLALWLGLLFVSSAGRNKSQPDVHRHLVVAAALSALLLLTFSLQSHNAALPGFQAIPATFSSWLHLFAMCAWLGGLYPLFRLLRAPWLDETVRGRIVPSFSGLAVVSVITLILTGLFAAILHVQSLSLLLTTTYGQALSLKTGLFMALLGLGAINLFILTPRLRAQPESASQHLRRTIRLELVVGSLLLLTVGILMGVSPAWEAWQAQQRLGFTETVRQDGVRLTLRVAPLQVGDNEMAVDVEDGRDDAAAVPATVILRLTPPDSADGITQVETVEQGGGRHGVRGSYLSQSGLWEVEVILRRRGFDDVRHIFTLVLPEDHTGHDG